MIEIKRILKVRRIMDLEVIIILRVDCVVEFYRLRKNEMI